MPRRPETEAWTAVHASVSAARAAEIKTGHAKTCSTTTSPSTRRLRLPWPWGHGSLRQSIWSVLGSLAAAQDTES